MKPKPIITVNTAMIASWFSVNPSTVSNWFLRYPDSYPEPDVVVTGPTGLEYWSWRPERRGEWEKWHKETVRDATKRNSVKKRYT